MFDEKFTLALAALAVAAVCAAGAFAAAALGLAWYVAPVAGAAYVLGRLGRLAR